MDIAATSAMSDARKIIGLRFLFFTTNAEIHPLIRAAILEKMAVVIMSPVIAGLAGAILAMGK